MTDQRQANRAALLSRFTGQECDLAEYLKAAGVLIPNETLADLPVRWVPKDDGQLKALEEAVAEFVLFNTGERAFTANWDEEADPPKLKRKRKPAQGDLIHDGPEPATCGGLCILHRWGPR